MNVITLLFSIRYSIKLEGEQQLEKKLWQWRKIAIGAYEQCSYYRLTEIHPVLTYEAWCAEQHIELKLNLDSRAEQCVNRLQLYYFTI